MSEGSNPETPDGLIDLFKYWDPADRLIRLHGKDAEEYVEWLRESDPTFANDTWQLATLKDTMTVLRFSDDRTSVAESIASQALTRMARQIGVSSMDVLQSAHLYLSQPGHGNPY